LLDYQRISYHAEAMHIYMQTIKKELKKEEIKEESEEALA
jgi:hypothetical protein